MTYQVSLYHRCPLMGIDDPQKNTIQPGFYQILAKYCRGFMDTHNVSYRGNACQIENIKIGERGLEI